jgi:hypothetical protein
MKYFTLLLILVSLLICNCDKDDLLACDRDNTGNLCIRNSYNEPVKLSINGSVLIVLGVGQTHCTDLPVGMHEIFVEENDYIFFPDVWDFTHTVNKCQDRTVVIN